MSEDPSLAAPAEKKPNWVLRIILGFLAGCLVLFLGGAFLIYRWVKSPENQERFGAIGEVMKTAMESANAPGTAELRALGCQTAVVMDGRSLKKVTDNVEKLAGGKNQDPPDKDEIPEELVSVICNLPNSSDVECAKVATTYASAVSDEPEKFMVLIQTTGFGAQKQKCMGMYAPDGSLIEDLEPPPSDDDQGANK